MPVNLKGRSFLTLKDFTPDEIRYMLNLAADLKAKKRAGIRGNLLAGKNIVLLFQKTSTRTRCAFEVGAMDLGMGVTYLDPESSQMGKKETMVDTAKVLGRFYDGIEYRGYDQKVVEGLAANAGVPVWNGLCSRNLYASAGPDAAGACRYPDADGEHQKASEQVQARLLRRHAQQRRLLPDVHLRQARHALCRLGPEGARSRG